MKRLVFCFDGTWNKLHPERATNVVLTAASIERLAVDGTAQLIHYDEGVGTGALDEWRGGMFGTGLVENVREAYRFLVFNYDPGDEIFVFGFSRGAYSARTFIGFLRAVGPLRRPHVGRIDDALKLYQSRKENEAGSADALRQFRATYSDAVCIGKGDDDWRCANVKGYLPGAAPRLRVRYLGAWDTVGALGVPEMLPFSDWLNGEHAFHDAGLDDFVESARHAVAIDERRELFPPVLFGDLTAINRANGFANDDPKAPYQERWFPGVHGSVGGGGDIRGLSDSALAWVLTGAKRAGLKLDSNHGTRIHRIRPDPFASLVNEADPEFSFTQLFKEDRDGPRHLWQLSPSAIRRWRTPAAKLGGKRYRPDTLKHFADELNAMGDWDFEAPTELIAVEEVQEDDTLSAYAVKHYGASKHWRDIYAANEDVIDDPNVIFPGQEIRIPRLKTSEKITKPAA